MSKKSSEAFKKLLEIKGINQYRLAIATGIDRTTINKIASGVTSRPNADSIKKIAFILKIDTNKLIDLFDRPDIFLKQPDIFLGECSPNNKSTQSNFEDILACWTAKADLVYSAPTCTFLSGEHCVVFGHPAIYLPLPMRLYIKLEASSRIEGITLDDFKCPDPKNVKNIANTELIDDYGRCSTDQQKKALTSLFASIIKPFFKKEFENFGFKISVLSSFPVAVGLNSSGALSACIAKALIDEFLNIELFKNHFELNNKDERELGMLLAWAIENCFHGGRSSGAGATISFNGRLGRHPIYYNISKRSYLLDRHLHGWKPIIVSESEEGFKALSKIRRFVFDPGEHFPSLPDYPIPPPYNITILYSGVPSRTADVLKRDIRSPVKSSMERVKYVAQMFDKTFDDKSFQNSLKMQRYDIIENIYLNTQLSDFDRSEQISYAYLELLSEALGHTSVGMFNSIVSDWNSVPDLMNSCQALLCSMGLSDLRTEYLINKLKSASIEKELQEGNLTSCLGAKITGVGKGGDIIVFSRYEPDVHEELILKNKQDINTIHFNSCELSDSEWNTGVAGVRRENLSKH